MTWADYSQDSGALLPTRYAPLLICTIRYNDAKRYTLLSNVMISDNILLELHTDQFLIYPMGQELK